jgi:hypothetical protein
MDRRVEKAFGQSQGRRIMRRLVGLMKAGPLGKDFYDSGGIDSHEKGYQDARNVG